MKRPEQTSRRVAKIAGRILAHNAEPNSNMALLPIRQAQIHLPWSDIRALAASALTQAPNKKRKKSKPLKGQGKLGKSVVRRGLAIWDKNTDAVDGSLIRGFSALYGEYSAELDTKRLVERIGKKFTPGKLLSAAKLAREMLQTNLSDSVAEVVKRAYNEGLRSGRLGKS